MTTLSGPGRAGSMKKLKKNLETGSGSFLRTIPGDDTLTVRFLEEPYEWFGYYEHWVDDVPVVCVEDDCEGCNSPDQNEQRRSYRYLTSAYVVDNSDVELLKLPKSLVDNLAEYADSYGTIMDRDYDLKKKGTGFNTTYSAVPDSPTKMKLEKYKRKMKDPEEALMEMVENQPSDEDDDDEDEEPRKTKGRRVWDDDDDDDDDEEDERPVRKVKSTKKKSPGKSSTSKSKPASKSTSKKTTSKKRRR